MSNHYQTLGIPDGAPVEVVRAAYGQALQRFLQSKQAGNPLPKEDFDALHAAYAELADPERKAIYDRQLTNAAPSPLAFTTPQKESPPGTPDEAPDSAPAVPRDDLPPNPHQEEEKEISGPVEHQLQFVGSGSEYFRIWIVNLLLSIVTLGIYSAWAKVRREQYFHRNTLLDGSGFDYHGNPVAILKGRLIAWTLFFILAYIDNMEHQFYFYALLAVTPLVPWLLVRSFIFRARNTSYRGLRFNFHGTYKGFCKIFIGYALLVIAMSWAMQSIGERLEEQTSLAPLALSGQAADTLWEPTWAQGAQDTAEAQETPFSSEEKTDEEALSGDDWEDDDAYLEDEEDDAEIDGEEEAFGLEDEETEDSDEMSEENKVLLGGLVLLFFLSAIVMLLITPALVRSFKLFQINHLSFGGCRFESKVSLGAFYVLFLRAAAIPMILMFCFVGAGAAVGVAAAVESPVIAIIAGFLFIIFALAFYISILVAQPYLQVRMTNLIWNNTRLREHSFASDLKFGAYIGIVLLNWILTIVTLGLYWPWAKVNLFAYRVNHTRFTCTSLDRFLGENIQEQHAAGEEIADAFDFDIAL